MRQSFVVYVRVDVHLSENITEATVKKQVSKFLKKNKLTDGIARAGVSEMTVTEVVEVRPRRAPDGQETKFREDK